MPSESIINPSTTGNYAFDAPTEDERAMRRLKAQALVKLQHKFDFQIAECAAVRTHVAKQIADLHDGFRGGFSKARIARLWIVTRK